MLKEYTGPKFGPPHNGWHLVIHKDGSVKEVKANGAFNAAQKAGWSLSDIVEMRFIKCPACDFKLDHRYGIPRPPLKLLPNGKKPKLRVEHTYVEEQCYEAPSGLD